MSVVSVSRSSVSSRPHRQEPVPAAADLELLRLAIDMNRQHLKRRHVRIPALQSENVRRLADALQMIPVSATDDRASVLLQLGATQNPEAIRFLLPSIGATSKDVRKAAATALGSIPNPMSAYLLLPMLLDDSARVRASALRALVQVGQDCTGESILAAGVARETHRTLILKTLQEIDPGVRLRHFDRFSDAAVLDRRIEHLSRALAAGIESRSGQSNVVVAVHSEGSHAAEKSPVTDRACEISGDRSAGFAGSAKTEDRIPTFAEPEQQPAPSYSEWFRESILPSRALTIFVAFYLHWLILFLAAGIYLKGPDLIPELALNAVFSDGPSLLEEVAYLETTIDHNDLQSELPELDSAVTVSSLTASALISTTAAVPVPTVPDILKGIPSAVGGQPSDETGAGAIEHPGNRKGKVAVPGSAVSAGSFCVWTEPENPDPGEPYKIIIQIQIPEGVEKYALSDLDGVVVGSDGYQKLIPGSLQGFLPVENGQVHLEVHIVSADEHVEDIVYVRSKLLREAQRLRLQF